MSTTSTSSTSSSQIATPATLALLAVTAVGVVAADMLNPQWDALGTMASHYANGRAGALIPLSLAALGLAAGWLAFRVHSAGRWLLCVFAIAVLVAAVAPADPPGNWDRPPSPAGMAHGVAGLFAFLVLAVAAVAVSRALTSEGLPTRPLWTASAFIIAAEIVFWITFVDVFDGPSLSLPGHPSLIGLTERVMLLAFLAWLGTLAVVLARRPR